MALQYPTIKELFTAIADELRDRLGIEGKISSQNIPDQVNNLYFTTLLKGREEGQTQGYKQGYSEGYDKGNREGTSAGYQSGYTEGEIKGREQGLTEGKEQGKTEAYGEIQDLNAELEQTLYGTNKGESLETNVEQTSSDFQAIKNKIVANGVGVAVGTKTAEYASKVDEVYEAGRKSQYDEFWDSFQREKVLVPYQFASYMWDDSCFYPKYDLISRDNIYGAFYSFGVSDLSGRLKECGLILDTSKATNIGNLFWSSYCTKIPLVSALSATNATNVFNECKRLVTIEGFEVHENLTYSNTFNNDDLLENLTIIGTIGQNDFNVQWSTKLTHDSLMSIITHLKDYSGTDTWKTITLGAANLAKLTTEELDIMQQKQWNYG